MPIFEMNVLPPMPLMCTVQSLKTVMINTDIPTLRLRIMVKSWAKIFWGLGNANMKTAFFDHKLRV